MVFLYQTTTGLFQDSDVYSSSFSSFYHLRPKSSPAVPKNNTPCFQNHLQVGRMASSASQNVQQEPIAIIGSACRFPGNSTSPSKLWDLLREPRDVLDEIPQSRFSAARFYHPDGQFSGHSNVTQSYTLEQNIALFDAPFFSIPAAEAAAMDPQQRLLLEIVYESLESAGLTIEGLRGSNTGVYAGVMYGDYEAMQFRDLQNVATYHATGTLQFSLVR